MPLYPFACTCGHKTDDFVSLEHRDDFFPCPRCGKALQRQMPLVNVLRFEPFYHEALDVDITGRKHQKEVYNAFGIIEAGDRKHGARNEEKSPLANRMVPLPPKGRSLSDIQREKERGRQIADDMIIGTGQARYAVGDLPNAFERPSKSKEAILYESVKKGIAAANVV